MIKKASIIIALIVLAFLAGCQSKSLQTTVVGLSTDGKASFQRMNRFELEAIPVDYIADCKVRVKTPDESYSGVCSIILTHSFELQISVFNPLGGIILQIYADDDEIRYKNYPDRSYLSFPNSEKNKTEIPLIGDISLVELQSILWGRQTTATKGTLDVQYRDEKPYLVTKRQDAFGVNVRYQKWMRFESLKFPKIFVIENPGKKSSLKFAITTFNPGYAKNLKFVGF